MSLSEKTVGAAEMQSGAASASFASIQTTSVESAPAPERTGPPDTTYYMKLGYIVAGVIFFAYIVLLMRRVASVRKQS